MSSLNLTLGPLVAGFTISTALYGVSNVQTYWYFRQFSGEHKFLNAGIVLIWLTELAHEASISCVIYQVLVTNFGNPHFLDKSPLALNLSVFFVGLEVALVQSVFIYRLWKANRQIVITVFMAALALLRLIANFVAGSKASVAPNFQQFIVDDRWLLIMLWVTAAVVDTSVTASMTYTLAKRRQNAVQKTTELLDKLILWTIETSLITTTAAIATAITFAVAPHNTIWIAIFLILPRLYSNSVLAALNQRGLLREQRQNVILSTQSSNSAPRMTIPGFSGTSSVNPDSDFHLSSSRARSKQLSSNGTQPVIAIEMNSITEMEYDVDDAKSDGKANV